MQKKRKRKEREKKPNTKGKGKKINKRKCDICKSEKLQEDGMWISAQCYTCGTFVAGQTDRQTPAAQARPFPHGKYHHPETF